MYLLALRYILQQEAAIAGYEGKRVLGVNTAELSHGEN